MRVKHVQLRATHKLIRERLVRSSTQRLQIAFHARTRSPGDPVFPVRELLAPPQNLVASTPRQRPLQLLCVNTRSQARPQTGSNRTQTKHTRGHMLVTTVAWFSPKILPLSHDLVVAEVVAAPVVVVVTSVTQPADPTWRTRRQSHHAPLRLRRHTPSSFSAGDTRLTSLCAPHVPRASDEPDEPDRPSASRTSRAHPTRPTSPTAPDTHRAPPSRPPWQPPATNGGRM